MTNNHPAESDGPAPSVNDGEENRPRWKHRRGDVYQAVQVRIVGNPEAGYSECRYLTGEQRSTRAAAERDGWRAEESDDFNVHVYRGGRLMASLWMGEIVDNDPEALREIEERTS